MNPEPIEEPCWIVTFGTIQNVNRPGEACSARLTASMPLAALQGIPSLTLLPRRLVYGVAD